MPTINPDHGWQCLERHLAKVRDPRRRALLECVRDHLKAEAEGDFPGMLGTLSSDPDYHFWVEGNGFGNGPKGRSAVQAHYEGLFRERRHVCDWDIDRIVVDEDTVVTEGWFEQLFPGKVLASRGARVDDEDAVYALRVRLLILWPFDADAKLVGEDSYMNGSMYAPENLRKLAPEEIPARFYELPGGALAG
ncbi:MAG: nuclear transport factor 2 family protein [Myxococcota bacterium]